MKDKKRVLFVAHVDSHIKAFHIPYLKLFKEQGYIVDVASNGDLQFQYCDHKYNLPFQRNPLSLYNIKAYKELKYILNKNKYDIVHCHTPVGGIIARLANKNCKYYEDTQMIYTAHGFHFFKGNNSLKNYLFRNIEKHFAKYTDILITINKEDNKAAQKFKLKKNGKIFLVHGVGIHLDYIYQIKYDRESFMNSLNIPKNSKLLLSVGEINSNKNQSVILPVLKKLPDEFHYIICGDGINKNNLKKEIYHLGLENRVHMLGYKKNVCEIMKCCDFFVFPSKREGLSVALMEAMACKLICIVSEIRGNIDLIDDKLGGYILNINDFPQELPHILLQTDNNYDEMIEYNIKKIKKYDFNTILHQMKVIYGLEK